MKGEILAIFNDLKKIKSKGSFVQNLAFVSSSKFLTLVFGFVFTPLLSRVYSPEAYGSFAIFNSYITLIAVAATLRLPITFLLEPNNKVFKSLLHACVILAFVFGVIAIPVFSLNIFGFDNIDTIGYAKHLIAPGILLTALVAIQGNWLGREKKFRTTSVRNTVVSLLSKAFSLAYGFFTLGKWDGLILSSLLLWITNLITNQWLLGKTQLRYLNSIVKKNFIFGAIKKYKNYPLYVLPTSWVSMFSSHAPIILLTPVFGLSKIGLMTFAVGLLDIPLRLIGESAVGPVLLQKTAELKNMSNKQELLLIFRKAFLALILISIPTFAVIICFGEEMFVFVFGDEWAESGSIASILCIVYMFRLINTPASSIIRIMGIEKQLIFISIAQLIVTFVAIQFSILGDQFMTYIWIYSLGYSSIYLFMSLHYYLRLKKSITSI